MYVRANFYPFQVACADYAPIVLCCQHFSRATCRIQISLSPALQAEQREWCQGTIALGLHLSAGRLEQSAWASIADDLLIDMNHCALAGLL